MKVSLLQYARFTMLREMQCANETTGEGNFADASHEPSGAATPLADEDGQPPKKKAKGLSKKAKTAKQRLDVIDGNV